LGVHWNSKESLKLFKQLKLFLSSADIPRHHRLTGHREIRSDQTTSDEMRRDLLNMNDTFTHWKQMRAAQEGPKNGCLRGQVQSPSVDATAAGKTEWSGGEH
jgi:hypothetical protein